MKVIDKTYQGFSRLTMSMPDKQRHTAKRIFDYLRKGKLDWDPWILKDGDIYRLFYLVGSNKVDPWWKKGAVYGAISTDLKHWTDVGVMLESGSANSWESGRICAGSACKDNNNYYLFYSASKADSEILQEGVGLATSTDGLHWQRYSHNPLLEPDDRWYSRSVKHYYYEDVTLPVARSLCH